MTGPPVPSRRSPTWSTPPLVIAHEHLGQVSHSSDCIFYHVVGSAATASACPVQPPRHTGVPTQQRKRRLGLQGRIRYTYAIAH